MITTSEKTTNICEAMHNVACQLQPIEKNTVNPFYNSKYANLTQLINSTRPILNEFGLFVMQSAEFSNEGRMLVHTRIAHTSGEWINATLPIAYHKNLKSESGVPYLITDTQTYGSAFTYARRYLYQAVFNLSIEDEHDGNDLMGNQ